MYVYVYTHVFMYSLNIRIVYLIIMCIYALLCCYCTYIFHPQYGAIEEMNVCDNLGDHLVGNVYIKVSVTCIHHIQLIKFYCDVITRGRSQLISSSIDTFFSKLCAYLAKQRRRRKANDG